MRPPEVVLKREEEADKNREAEPRAQDPPSQIPNEHELENAERPHQIRRKLPLLDLRRDVPVQVTGDEHNDDQIAEIVKDDPALIEPLNRPVCEGIRVNPDERHGDRRDDVGENPNDHARPISERFLEIDAEQSPPFAHRPSHHSENTALDSPPLLLATSKNFGNPPGPQSVPIRVIFAAAVIFAGPTLVRVQELSSQPQQVIFDPTTKNLAWAETAKDRRGVYLLKMSSKKVVKISSGNIAYDQADCGQGLVSVYTTENNNKIHKTITFRMADGVKVGGTNDHYRRRGRLFQTPSGIIDLNGKMVHPIPNKPGKSPRESFGFLIWDGKRRLTIIGRPRSESKDVVALNANWSRGKSVWLSDYAFGFDALVGNPDKGTFAVFESSNRTRQVTGIYTKDLKRLAGDKPLDVTDIGPNGIVATRLKFDERRNDYVSDGTICMDSATGQVKWTGRYGGRWWGQYILSSDMNVEDAKPVIRVVNGKDGRLLHTLNLSPRTVAVRASYGDYIVTQEQNPSKLVVFRIKR